MTALRLWCWRVGRTVTRGKELFARTLLGEAPPNECQNRSASDTPAVDSHIMRSPRP